MKSKAESGFVVCMVSKAKLPAPVAALDKLDRLRAIVAAEGQLIRLRLADMADQLHRDAIAAAEAQLIRLRLADKADQRKAAVECAKQRKKK